MSLEAEIPPGSKITEAQLDDLRKVFMEFDTNGSGYISRSEFANALSKVKERRTKDTNAIALNMLRSVDEDGDNRVSFQEFVDGVAYKTNQRGESTKPFRSLVGVIAKGYLKKEEEQENYIEEYHFWPPPVFILIATIVEVVVYAIYSARECGGSASLECPFSFSSSLAFRPGCREEVWRFITYVLVHASVSHIVFNCVLQVILGIPLEMVHGPLRVAGVYIMGGLAGSLASSVFDNNANLVGASAAIYAIVGAHVADTFLNFAEMPFRWLRVAVLTVLCVADFSISVYNRYYSESATNVSYTGHLAGFLMGCTLGTVILRNLEGNKYEKIVGYVGVALAVGGIIFAIFFNIFYDYTATSCPKGY